MQDSKGDADKGQRVGIDEQFIKFRPSPNLKKIKKFFKATINSDNDACGANTAGSTSPSCAQEPEKKDITPPLPLDPPPADTPTTPAQGPLEQERNEDHKEEAKSEKPFVMCKNFVRGTCNLGNSCRYVHKIDKNQLKDVYKFCHIYQNNNNVCNLAVCKYVHADIFEAAEFERSGYLPPHCTAHWAKQKPKGVSRPLTPRSMATFLMPPPLPPPPPPSDHQNRQAKPAGQPTRPAQPPLPMPAKTAAPIGDQIKLTAPVAVPAASFVAAVETNVAKKVCPNCVVMDNRLNHAKKQLDSMKMSIQALNEKINNVVWCDNFLRAVLAMQQEKLPVAPAISNGSGNQSDDWNNLLTKLHDSFNSS